MAPEETKMFNFRKRLIAAAAATAVAAIALSGCTPAASRAGSPSAAADGTLTIGTIVASTTFAVNNSAWANESPYLQAVYDTLLHADPDGTVKPWLA
ncbi:MAG: ABC transporter substrate-binding protein, partial [Leifsonia sp.]